MRAARALVGFVAVSAATGPVAATGQPVTERPPNLEGTWVTSPRTLYFAFVHRFEVVGGDVDVTDIFGDGKVLAYPTFHLAYGLLEDVNLGLRYSSNSLLAGGPNEWQPYVKWSPLRSTGGPRLGLSATAAWNGAAQSADGEIAGEARFGRLGVLGAVRGFSDAFDRETETSGAALALAGGALFRVTRHLAVAADAAHVVAGAEGDVAWSAGLQVGIPYTPHTFSLMATNVSSGTLQGVSTGIPGVVWWGFEFTVPFSGFARWGDIFEPEELETPLPAPAPGAAGPERARPAGPDAGARPVVEVGIRGFEYERSELRVPAGTVVRWINRDPVGHTVTSDDDDWSSSLIGPGDVFERTFETPGTHPYHCIPHPYMKARVVVLAPGDPTGSDTP